MKFIVIVIFTLLNSFVHSQSKSEQIEMLLYRVDSLRITHSSYLEKSQRTQKECEDKLSYRTIELASLNDSIRNLKKRQMELEKLNFRKDIELNELKISFEKQIDSLKNIIANQMIKWNIETFEVESKKTSCFKFDNVPYCFVSSAPVSQVMVDKINFNLDKLKFTIPLLLNAQESNVTNDCAEWNKNLCDRPWSVYNEIEYVNAKKYFSILQSSQLEFCGATWASRGYTSYNFDFVKGEDILIKESVSNKNVLRDEIKIYFDKLKISEPFQETTSGIEKIEYDIILTTILKFPMSRLTFYFNEDVLTLAFYNYIDSWTNRMYYIPLPKFQAFLNL